MSGNDVGPGNSDPIAQQIASTAKQARQDIRQSDVDRRRALQEVSSKKNRSLGFVAGGLMLVALAMTIFNLVGRSREAPTLSSMDEQNAAESFLAAQVSWVEAYRDETGSLPNDLGESMLPEKDRVWKFTSTGDEFSLTFAGEDEDYTFDSGRDSARELGAEKRVEG